MIINNPHLIWAPKLCTIFLWMNIIEIFFFFFYSGSLISQEITCIRITNNSRTISVESFPFIHSIAPCPQNIMKIILMISTFTLRSTDDDVYIIYTLFWFLLFYIYLPGMLWKYIVMWSTYKNIVFDILFIIICAICVHTVELITSCQPFVKWKTCKMYSAVFFYIFFDLINWCAFTVLHAILNFYLMSRIQLIIKMKIIAIIGLIYCLIATPRSYRGIGL